MKLQEAIRSSSIEIRAHKTRSALSCLSLAVGVAAILYTFSQVLGVDRQFRKAAELAGPGRITIDRQQEYVSRGLSPGLTTDDAQAIHGAWPELYMMYPLVRHWGTRMVFGDFHSKDILVLGTAPEWRLREWVYTMRGRFLDPEDLREASRVCVLVRPGGWIEKPWWARFFPDQPLEAVMKHRDLLGREVEIEDHLYRVIGIIRGPPMDEDPRWFKHDWDTGGDGLALVPITTYQHYLASSNQPGGIKGIDRIEIDTGREETVLAYKKKIEGLMDALHHGEKDVKVTDLREQIEGAVENVRQWARAVLAIGIVAILAGGIGILNVTLATVFSRIREIGIRRALGATRFDVVLQFVTEAMLLGFLGGGAGLPAGLAAARWLAYDQQYTAMPGLRHMALALGIAVGTGLLFSIYPAWLASRFDPIEALRYE